tara:strand:+ start:625 stop:1242 length:618 start_codon:yes stop_codon:yes gene_type:complete
MDCFTKHQIQSAVESKGYKWFEGGDYNLNIVGIRNSTTCDEITNKFDDCLSISYSVQNESKFICFKCTTDPGIYYSEDLLNPDGVAILKPNQYRSSYQIGLHQGKYEALIQKLPVEVYRDNNRDDKYNLNEYSLQEGMFGINIHRATSNIHGTSTQIDKWSAGCQVVASYDDFQKLMELVNLSKDIYGNSFTYTLIESKDIINLI